MVKFLIHRPIAVSMTFIAILILGIIGTRKLPVSLMPDLDVPRITVHIDGSNRSARELENSVVRGFRQQLMQINNLENITSETRDGHSVISLDFSFGTSIDFAFIEVNEKVDRAMATLPKDFERPVVIRAGASDIPVFYLDLSLKDSSVIKEHQQFTKEDETARDDLFPVPEAFSELSIFASQVIKKRIEQLPVVAIADISGLIFPEILLLPDMEKLSALDITTQMLTSRLANSNVTLGNLSIKDGQYQYNVKFENKILDKTDIENTYINIHSRVFQLKELAEVVYHPRKISGKVISDLENAITLGIIKQSDAKIRDLRGQLEGLIRQFNRDYPDIQFKVTRNQTRLLDYTLSNLWQSLLLGALLAFVLMFLFLNDVRSPLLIGITIPTSLVITMLFFYLAGLTLNIISLSGLILGIGIMIDNSIIVIDNITQHREQGKSLNEACVDGTNEVIRPLISSVLTTCAVFLPLIFLKGISGALFYDQAIAISLGLFVSLLVSVTLLPVYYRIAFRRNEKRKKIFSGKRIKGINYSKMYSSGFRFVFRHQPLVWTILVVMLVAGYIMFRAIPKEKLPPMKANDIVLALDWNEQLNIDENERRVKQLLTEHAALYIQHSGLIGRQQFLLDQHSQLSGSEAVIYLESKNLTTVKELIREMTAYLSREYPKAVFSFKEAGNIFELLFAETQPPLLVRLITTGDFGPDYLPRLQHQLGEIAHTFPDVSFDPIALQDQLVLAYRPEMFLLYNIDKQHVVNAIKNAFRENEIMVMTSGSLFVPVVIGTEISSIEDVIATLTVKNKSGKDIRLSDFISIKRSEDLKYIYAGMEGEYYPLPFRIADKEIEPTIAKLRTLLQQGDAFEATFSGAYFSNRQMISDLFLILLVSLFLLYFILAAQFESIVLPVIVLSEVVIDIFGALLLLYIFGSSLNLMSLIGIVVMSGIIINDSILKIDTINQMYNSGTPLLKALVVAGHRRLKPILMTSLTTVLALVPFFFLKGMGSDIQKPLALSIIGGMLVGTLVSLYFIPLGYYYLNRRRPFAKAQDR